MKEAGKTELQLDITDQQGMRRLATLLRKHASTISSVEIIQCEGPSVKELAEIKEQ
jgi:hypothetical protein